MIGMKAPRKVMIITGAMSSPPARNSVRPMIDRLDDAEHRRAAQVAAERGPPTLRGSTQLRLRRRARAADHRTSTKRAPSRSMKNVSSSARISPGDDLGGERRPVDDLARRSDSSSPSTRSPVCVAQAVDRRPRHLERAVLDEPVLDVVGGLRQRRPERVELDPRSTGRSPRRCRRATAKKISIAVAAASAGLSFARRSHPATGASARLRNSATMIGATTTRSRLSSHRPASPTMPDPDQPPARRAESVDRRVDAAARGGSARRVAHRRARTRASGGSSHVSCRMPPGGPCAMHRRRRRSTSPGRASSRAPVISAPYAARASDPPVDTRRTPAAASSATDRAARAARGRSPGCRPRARTRSMSAIAESPGAYTTSAPASRYAISRAIVSSRSPAP